MVDRVARGEQSPLRDSVASSGLHDELAEHVRASAATAPQSAAEAAGAKGAEPFKSVVDENKTYDYVFIGAGATGGTAAAALVDDLAKVDVLKKQGFSVLMLEGGVDKVVPKSDIPLKHAEASEDPDLLADPNRSGSGTGYWVRHFDDDKQALKDPKARADGMVWKPRGEGFGGSTRMNANIFVRVDDKDWDDIALSTGDPAFRAQNMKPLYEDLTKTNYRPELSLLNSVGKATGVDALQNIGGHGFNGPIELSRANPLLLLQDRQLAEIGVKGLLWSFANLGSPLEKAKRLVTAFDPNDDLTQGTEGPLLVPMSVSAEGKRVGARNILLGAKERHPDQLTLQDGARVDKILLDDKSKVTGVHYIDPDGKEHTVKVGREAIISAGAMESAALLLRSGIGPKDELDKLKSSGIEEKDIVEGVGRKQGFRYEIAVVERLKQPFKVLQDLKAQEEQKQESKQADGAVVNGAVANGVVANPEAISKDLLATNGAFLAWQSRSRPDLENPDLFVFAVPGKFEGYEPGYSKEVFDDANLVSFVILDANKGQKNGTLELDPKNPNGAPLINHHFYADQGDKDAAPLVAGVKQVREFIASQLGDITEAEVWPGKQFTSDKQIGDKIINESWDHHPRGGVQLGDASDPSTVVDSDFKVVGTTGLRVIDASVLPDNIGEFIVSGLYQVGKLAADKIAEDAMQTPHPAEAPNKLSIVNDAPPKTIAEAQKVTSKAAAAAEAHGLITASQASAISDGTVSHVDLEECWQSIRDLLAHGAEKGSEQHTIAHNLLLSISHQLALQGHWETEEEDARDHLFSALGSR